MVTATLTLGIASTALAGSGKPAGDVSAAGEVSSAGGQSTTAGGYRYVTKAGTNFAGDQNFATANCPDDEPVVSGGVYSFGGFGTQHVNSLHPHDDGDANAAPEDGWRAWVDNISAASDKVFRVFAVCDMHPTTASPTGGVSTAAGPGVSALGYRYVTQVEASPAGEQAIASPDCPAGEPVVGGGVFSSGDWGQQHVFISYPEWTRNTWPVFVENIGSQNETIQAFTVCDRHPSDLGYRYRASEEPADAGQQSTAEVGCRNTQTAVGGGGSGSTPQLHLNSTVRSTVTTPTALPTTDGPPGWTTKALPIGP